MATPPVSYGSNLGGDKMKDSTQSNKENCKLRDWLQLCERSFHILGGCTGCDNLDKATGKCKLGAIRREVENTDLYSDLQMEQNEQQ